MSRGINHRELTESDKGRWVEYWPSSEKGRIKSWNKSFVFVVYKCGGNWNDYQNYTAASTHPKSLRFLQDSEKPLAKPSSKEDNRGNGKEKNSME